MLSSTLRPNISVFVNKTQFLRTITTTNTVDGQETEQLKSWKEIPGPSSIPVVGILHHFLPRGSFHNLNGLALMEKLFNDYGPIVRLQGILGKEQMIALFDAESSSQILRGENRLPIRAGFHTLEHYRKSVKNKNSGKITGLITEHGDSWKEFRTTVNPVLLQPKTIRLYNKVIDEVAMDMFGFGIMVRISKTTTSKHGDSWKEFRTTVNPVLLQPKTIRLYNKVIDEVAMDMVHRLKSIRDENNQIKGDISQELNKWSLESIGMVALGCRLNCLDPNLPDDAPAKRLIKCVHDMFVAANELDFKPSLWRLISTPTYKKAMALYKEQEEISKYFIDKAKQELKTKEKNEDEKGILEKLLEINEEYAHIMASDMLIAGVDTVANSITAALYLLATNREKQAKLREELRTDPEKRPYLRACLKEAIRIMPVVSGNLRATTKEYNLLGYKIPVGVAVALNHQFMSLTEEHFPRSKEFIPERWLADKNDPLYYRNANPFAYNPFGFGVRSCIGRRIAELEMETFLARMVENFDMEWFGEPPVVFQTSFNYIKGPFNFIFKDVKK